MTAFKSSVENCLISMSRRGRAGIPTAPGCAFFFLCIRIGEGFRIQTIADINQYRGKKLVVCAFIESICTSQWPTIVCRIRMKLRRRTQLYFCWTDYNGRAPENAFKQGSDGGIGRRWVATGRITAIRTCPHRCVAGDFHLHDLGLLGAYCVGWDLQDLLISGFKGVAGKAESRPAKHLRTALGQVVNFFYTLQGESAGAQAFSNFDTLLAPFIYYDNLSYQEVKQALQEFLFNVNVPTRVGFQTPFTNVTMDFVVPSYYKNQGVIIGGKIQDKKYGEFQKEMDIFNKAFLELMLEGDAKGRVFTFPIPTYNITKDFDWDNPAYKPLWDITAKYGIPYFANFVNSDMNPEDARSMCCRLRIDNRELNRRGGGLFGSAPLTGSIGVVTINMPRIGYLASTEEEFFKLLEERMDVAKLSLEIKRKVIERFTNANLYPYMSFYLRSVKQRFNEYWKNHFSTIGLVGLNEACLNLLGESVGSEKGRKFGVKVMDFMRAKLIEYQKETGNNYNLEATPAEGTSYRLAKLDREKYPDIIVADNEQAAQGRPPFYTNSSQLPVNYTDDIFELLDLQDEIQAKYTGGTVLHIFMGERIKDTEALKKFIRKVCEGYQLPYFSITPTFSVCPKCGYIEGEHFECPKCKAEKIENIEKQIALLEEQLYSK